MTGDADKLNLLGMAEGGLAETTLGRMTASRNRNKRRLALGRWSLVRFAAQSQREPRRIQESERRATAWTPQEGAEAQAIPCGLVAYTS